jgi:hypothetical protein
MFLFLLEKTINQRKYAARLVAQRTCAIEWVHLKLSLKLRSLFRTNLLFNLRNTPVRTNGGWG